MAQTRNKYENKYIKEDGLANSKALPNFFDTEDGIKPLMGLSLSVLAHVLFMFLVIVVTIIQGLIFPHLPKPELPNRNLEFKLVQNESKPPINKNTKIRSDRDSQAGGKHDPKKSVSEPSKAAAPKTKKAAVTPQIKQQQKKVEKTPVAKPQAQQKPAVKPVQKPVQKQPIEQVQKVVSKPTPAKPVVVKPTVKPIVQPQGVAVPSAPKIATAPKSPFAVPVPSVKAPVGTTYKPSGSTDATSGSNNAAGSSSASAPVPKFSSSGGASGSSGGPQYASRGSSGGYGSGGNPSPGNPNGAPGIDALRQPNWGPYMKNLEQRIKRNWTPPKGDSSKRVVINFVIGRDGRLLSAKVVKSSGVPLADRAAMSAIELTAPFAPLPPEFRGSSVPIEFTFDYNVINSIMR